MVLEWTSCKVNKYKYSKIIGNSPLYYIAKLHDAYFIVILSLFQRSWRNDWQSDYIIMHHQNIKVDVSRRDNRIVLPDILIGINKWVYHVDFIQYTFSFDNRYDLASFIIYKINLIVQYCLGEYYFLSSWIILTAAFLICFKNLKLKFLDFKPNLSTYSNIKSLPFDEGIMKMEN